MLRSTAPIAKQYQRLNWNLNVPAQIVKILNDVSNKPLEEPEKHALKEFYIRKGVVNLPVKERRYIVDFLFRRQAYLELNRFAQRYLVPKGDLDDNSYGLSFRELRQYCKSLIATGNMVVLDQIVTKIIAESSIEHKRTAINFVNFLFTALKDGSKVVATIEPEEVLLKWAKWMKLLNGHCDFENYTHQKDLLKPLLFYLREKRNEESEFFQRCLDKIKAALGASIASQLSSTLIYLEAYNRSFELVRDLWDYKINNNLVISSSDLTCILKCYCHFEEYDLVERTHAAFPHAHDEHQQFDYLLIAYSKSQNWKGLQDQFNALFNIGELPNIEHYGIVMSSMAAIGELDSVEKLYAQLLRRNMLPTYTVLQSLLYAHFKAGNLNSCFAQFELFEKYSIRPSPSTYTLMFKVFRALNNIDGALRLLKRATESDIDISEGHFALLIQMCSKFTNPLIAQELFHIMEDHYNIPPTGKSISALMDVYIESNLPQKSLSLFKRYKHAKLENRLSIFNKAIKAYIAMGNSSMCESTFQEIVDLRLSDNSEFFRGMIKYLAVLKKDYATAESVLDQLLKHPTIKPDVSHFEVLMQAYDKIAFREGIHNLYKKMNENKIPVNSKVIYYLVKATFKVQMKTQGDLKKPIELLDRIMSNAAEKTLDITFNQLHPSVVAWPMRVVAKYYNPMKAIDLLNRYNQLFYGKEDISVNGRLTIMRSLLVFSAEIEQWDEFDNIFERYVARIDSFEKQPSATMRNTKLRTAFKGLIFYKVRHLVATHNIQALPELLNSLEARGFVIDNISWNEAVKALFQDSRTIKTGLKIVNDKLIHGFNIIHKFRFLRKHAGQRSLTDQSWFLRRKKMDPSSFNPSLYLTSEAYSQVTEYMDRYLSSLPDLNNNLSLLMEEFPYFMKSYLMKPRNTVKGWETIEAQNASFLAALRSTKRIESISQLQHR
ncbi:hypothetical protein HG537_0B06750 [Torulaspora globosa]|uniref:Pentacotripeptide-repeat region of PRORP domain-containing protein n=1 Tax=Torulaspora globosa TaxID=48254 RepID=A0A7H9HRL0_9SACH|nr:hypothetical protein HG537_0B06750 [Torulaspora sp. CBS 2947]